MLSTILLLAIGSTWQDWYAFEPDSKTFRVELPRMPNQTRSRDLTTAAGPSKLTSAMMSASDGEFTIHVTENRAKVDPKTLEDGINKFAASKNATLGTIREITVDDNPGREFEITLTGADGPKKSKMLLGCVGQFAVHAGGLRQSRAQVPADGDRFLGSLEIGAAKIAERHPAPAKPVEVAPGGSAAQRDGTSWWQGNGILRRRPFRQGRQ